jgi:hypothetical protein
VIPEGPADFPIRTATTQISSYPRTLDDAALHIRTFTGQEPCEFCRQPVYL